MATLTIKHGARPRYLPKKITNYTYVERENKRIYNYKYTEDEKIEEGCPKIDYRMVAVPPLSVLDPKCLAIMSDGDEPHIPVWEYNVVKRIYNDGTPYEFELEEIAGAYLVLNGQMIKRISFNENVHIVAHYESGARDYHEETDKYIKTMYLEYSRYSKVALYRGILHTFWMEQGMRYVEIDGRQVVVRDGFPSLREECSGDNGSPVIGIPLVQNPPTRFTAYNCEVKLELEEE